MGKKLSGEKNSKSVSFLVENLGSKHGCYVSSLAALSKQQSPVHCLALQDDAPLSKQVQTNPFPYGK